MSIPRTQRLIGVYSATAAAQGQWTGPSGHVTLVKSLHTHNGSAAAAVVQLFLSAPGWGAWVLAINISLQVGAHFDWDGWLALNPGDAILVTCSAAGVSAWVSGSVLVGDPQFPPGLQEEATQLPAIGLQPAPRSAQPGMPQPF